MTASKNFNPKVKFDEYNKERPLPLTVHYQRTRKRNYRKFYRTLNRHRFVGREY